MISSSFSFLGAFAQVGGIPALDSPLSEFSCQLRKQSYIDGVLEDQAHCSGVFIKTSLFVTAAHCFKGDYAAGDLTQRNDVRYTITCPGNKTVSVKETFLNPEYFYEMNSQEGPLAKKECVNSNNQYICGRDFLTSPKKDIALLRTEEITWNPPTLPKMETRKPKIDELLRKNQCSFLGYSPSLCDSSTGKGCLRNSIDIELKPNGFISSERLLGQKGDSGAGVICKSDDGDHYHVGVYASTNGDRQITPNSENSEFLSQFDSQSLPTPLHFSDDFIDGYLLENTLKEKLKDRVLFMTSFGYGFESLLPLYNEINKLLESPLSEYLTRNAINLEIDRFNESGKTQINPVSGRLKLSRLSTFEEMEQAILQYKLLLKAKVKALRIKETFRQNNIELLLPLVDSPTRIIDDFETLEGLLERDLFLQMMEGKTVKVTVYDEASYKASYFQNELTLYNGFSLKEVIDVLVRHGSLNLYQN